MINTIHITSINFELINMSDKDKKNSLNLKIKYILIPFVKK